MKPRRRWLRRLAWAAAGLAIALALAAAAIPAAVSSDRFRAEVEAQASRALGRSVSVSGIDLSLLGGCRLAITGVRVGNPPGFGSAPLADVREILAEVAVTSFWSNRLVVEGLVLRGASVRLERRADGATNLDGLAWRAPSGWAGRSGMLAAAGPSAITLKVARIRLEDAHAAWSDAAAGFSAIASGIAIDARVDALPLSPGSAAPLSRAVCSGQLSVREASTDGVRIEGIRCGLALANGEARLSGGEALLNAGAVRFEASACVSGPPDFTLRADLRDAKLTPELGARWLGRFLVCFRRGLQGRLSKASVDLSWRGSSRPEVNATLAGRGTLELDVNAVDLAQLLTSDVDKWFAGDRLTFTTAKVDFTAGDGMVLNTLLLAAPGNGARLTGTTALADGAIDYRVDLSGRVGNRSLRITGTLTDPRPDMIGTLGALDDRAADELARQLGRLLE